MFLSHKHTHTHTHTLSFFQVVLKDRIHWRICNYISQVCVPQACLFVLVFRNEMAEDATLLVYNQSEWAIHPTLAFSKLEDSILLLTQSLFFIWTSLKPLLVEKLLNHKFEGTIFYSFAVCEGFFLLRALSHDLHHGFALHFFFSKKAGAIPRK